MTRIIGLPDQESKGHSGKWPIAGHHSAQNG
jgi:hypothetical protein